MSLLGLLIFLSAAIGSLGHMHPAVCMDAPIIPLTPGSIVSARLDVPRGKRCEATLKFSNLDFLPLHFSLTPQDCLGAQRAEFTVPPEVPNGEAFILWHCVNQPSPSCTKTVITEASGDANALNYTQSGTVTCISSAATRTTLTTITGSSTTYVSTLTSVESTTPSADSSPNITPELVEIIQNTLTDGTRTFATSFRTTLSTPQPTPDREAINRQGFQTSVLPGNVETVTTTITDGSSTIATTFETTRLPSTVLVATTNPPKNSLYPDFTQTVIPGAVQTTVATVDNKQTNIVTTLSPTTIFVAPTIMPSPVARCYTSA